MAKKQQKSTRTPSGKKVMTYYGGIKQALEKFDLFMFRSILQKHNLVLYKQFIKSNEEVQMGTMCKMICDRTDMLGTEAHKKAVKWLKEHNMKGRLF